MQRTALGWYVRAAFSAWLLAGGLSVALVAASPPSRGPLVIAIPGATSFLNYCLGSGPELSFAATETAGPVGLAADGDLLGVECPLAGNRLGMVLVPYRESDGTDLDVALAESWFLLAGRLVAFAGDDDEAWTAAFLEAMAGVGPQGLRDLRLVRLGAGLAPEVRPALAALAAETPGVDTLMVADLSAASVDLLALFRPRQIVLDQARVGDLGRLAGSTVQSLFIADPDGLDFSVLARLPELRSLVLLDTPRGTLRLPRKGALLERLVVRGDGLEGIRHLEAQRGLRHLAVVNLPPGTVRQVARLPCLEALVLGVADGAEAADLSALRRLSGLSMLGVQGGVTQADFDGLLAANPRLRVVQVVDCDEIVDLSAVRWLSELEALVCPGAPTPDAAVLEGLPRLRLLALASDAFSAEKAESLLGLGERLPECRVAPVRGICLGSGWLLLLAPVLGAAFLARRIREDRRGAL